MMTEENSSFYKQFPSFQFECKLNKEALTINGKIKSKQLLFGAYVKNSKLPTSCTNIFDSINQIFAYLRTRTQPDIEIDNNTFKIKVKLEHLSKVKIVQIPLQSKAFGKQQTMQLQIETLKDRIQKLQTLLERSIPEQIDQYLKLHIHKKVEEHELRLKTLEGKNINLNKSKSSSREIQQNNHKEYHKDVNFKKTEKGDLEATSNQPLTKLNLIRQKSQQQIDRLEMSSSFQGQLNGTISSVQQLRQNDIGKDPIDFRTKQFKFQIDFSNDYLQYYNIRKNLVIRKVEDQKSYQIYSLNQIPDRCRQNIKFRFNQVSPGSISFGIITEDKKQLECIRQEQGTIVMGSDDGYQLFVDGKPQQLMLQKLRNGILIEMQVQIRSRKVRFYRNGNHQSPYVKLQLPQSMWGAKLYPFFQIKKENNSVQLL